MRDFAPVLVVGSIVVGAIAIVKCPAVGVVLVLLLLAVYWSGTSFVPQVNGTPIPPAPIAFKIGEEAAAEFDTLPPMLAPFGECQNVKPGDVFEQTVPAASNTRDGVVLGEATFDNPGQVDRMCENQWFTPGQTQTYKEKQQADFTLHRATRRDKEWSATARWTKEDKEKYERARRRMEADIASALRPDPYMVVERDPKATYEATSDQPFAAINSDHTIFHSAHFRNKATGTGNLASFLKTKI